MSDPVPRRTESAPRARPVRALAEERAGAIVREWASRTTAKQRLTGKRLHRQLRGEGIAVGITTVRVTLRRVAGWRP